LSLWSDARKKTLWMIFFYVAALLSKESALIFPGLLWASGHFALKKKRLFSDFLPVLFTTAVYLALRLTVLVPIHFSGEAASFLKRAPGIFAALWGFTGAVLWPWAGLHMEYGTRFFSWRDPGVWAGLSIFALVIFALTRACYGRSGPETKRVAAFGLAWFLTAWLPISGVLPLYAFMAEHWLYLPSLGLFLLAGLGLSKIYGKKSLRILTMTLFGGIVLLFSFLTIRQNLYWSDPAHFARTTLKYAPDSYRSEYTLGLYYGAIGRKAEAAAHYEHAFTLNPGYTEAYYNLGNLLASVHEDQRAVYYYLRAVAANPRYVWAYNNLGNTYSRLGQSQNALNAYQKCLELDPANEIVLKNFQAEILSAKQKS